jgi:hypothetical protein
MSEPFVLSNPEKTKQSLIFAPPSKAMLCRQALWAKCRLADPNPLVLTDFYKYDEKFSPNIVYQAARRLVLRGLLERRNVPYSYLAKGKERTGYRTAVKFVPPFESGSRFW